MTKTQRKRAVAVAKDVLKQLKYLDVRTDSYVVVTGFTGMLENLEGEQLQKVLPFLFKESKPCRVCALGACFMSHVNLYNEYEIDFERFDSDQDNVSLNRTAMVTALEDTFGNRNLDLIETAFEQRWVEGELDYQPYNTYDGTAASGADLDIVEAAIAFGQKYDDDEARLKAIMKNVIKNNGEFKP